MMRCSWMSMSLLPVLWLACMAGWSEAQDNYGLSPTTPQMDAMEQARQTLREEDLQTSVAEERVAGKYMLVYGGYQNDTVAPKASKVHDRVTFVINEATEAKHEATIDLQDGTTMDWDLESLFSLDIGPAGRLVAKPYDAKTGADLGDIDPNATREQSQSKQMKYETDDEHDSEGSTERKQSFKTKLSGSVIDVHPNGFLVVEAVTQMQINTEDQTVSLTGVIDPRDLNEDNEVTQDRIMNLRLRFFGKGEVTDTVKQGWYTRLIKKVKPF